MSWTILKADRDRDLYCAWSSIVEAPVFIGDRESTADHYVRRGGVSRAKTDAYMDLADEQGSSHPAWEGAWTAKSLVYMRTVLPRENLGALLDICIAHLHENLAPDHPLVKPLVQRFEED